MWRVRGKPVAIQLPSSEGCLWSIWERPLLEAQCVMEGYHLLSSDAFTRADKLQCVKADYRAVYQYTVHRACLPRPIRPLPATCWLDDYGYIQFQD